MTTTGYGAINNAGGRTIEITAKHVQWVDYASRAIYAHDALVAALRALVAEIDLQRGLKVDANGILDPLHPICVQAENARALLHTQEP